MDGFGFSFYKNRIQTPTCMESMMSSSGPAWREQGAAAQLYTCDQ